MFTHYTCIQIVLTRVNAPWRAGSNDAAYSFRGTDVAQKLGMFVESKTQRLCSGTGFG